MVVFERIPEATRRPRDGPPISPWPGWELLLDAIGPGAGVLEDSLGRGSKPRPGRDRRRWREVYDVREVRRDFPILDRRVGETKLVYLHNANIHRGVHRLAEEATALYEGSRERVARFLGAPDVRGLIFTRGTTESIN